MITIITILSFSLLANAKNYDNERAPTCNRAALQACTDQHNNERNKFRDLKNESYAKQDQTNEKIGNLNKILNTLMEGNSLISQDLLRFQSESELLNQDSQNYAEIATFEELSSIFSIPIDQFFWSGKYATLLLAQQNTQASDLELQLNKNNSQISIFASDLQLLQQNLQEYQNKIGEYSYLESEHDRMCNSGCREQYCRE